MPFEGFFSKSGIRSDCGGGAVIGREKRGFPLFPHYVTQISLIYLINLKCFTINFRNTAILTKS